MMRAIGLGTALLLIPFAAASEPQTAAPRVTIADARASLTGAWEGKLEYRDYSADRWFGIPVKTRIEDQGDGATIIRKSDFDDGPAVGNVRITSVELFDAKAGTVSVGTFRKGRAVEVTSYSVRLEGSPVQPTAWVMVEEADGRDDNRPARIRLTTTRDGAALETVKMVDFLDDEKSEWLTRNRTRLTRVGD
jgi:hypothetical protein